MKKTYTRQQIVEAIDHWKRLLESLDESEDSIDYDNGMLICSTRDLIYNDAKILDDEIELRELNPRKLSIGLQLDRAYIDKINVLEQKHPGEHRIIAYIYNGSSCEKWHEADREIEDRNDFERYVDPNSEWNIRYPDEYDADFSNAFRSYEEWMNFKFENAKKKFSSMLKNTGKIQYEYAANDIRMDSNGVIYTLIIWKI